jgi:hypothetical protein
MAKINFKAVSARATKAAGLVGGVMASRYAKKTLEGVGGGKIKPAMNAGIRLAIGALLPSIVGGKKAGIAEDISNGLMADAAVSLAATLGVPGLAGTDQSDSLGDLGDVGYATNEDWMLSGTDHSGSLGDADDYEG